MNQPKKKKLEQKLKANPVANTLPDKDTNKEVLAPIESKVIEEKKDAVEKIVPPESIIDKTKNSSHLSLEKLEIEVETELNKPEILKVEEDEAKPTGTLDLNEENLASSWKHFLEQSLCV